MSKSEYKRQEAYDAGFKAGSTGAMTREEVCESERRHFDEGRKIGHAAGWKAGCEKMREEAAYQTEIFYGPGAGPTEAWRAGVQIASAIRSLQLPEKPEISEWIVDF